MKLFKVNATNSTNTLLKEYLLAHELEDFTIISTDFQEKGRGQRETKWYSGKGKNLLFSVFKKFECLKAEDHFYLNMSISLGLISALQNHLEQDLRIKWPNDILAGNKKIAGILIENSMRNTQIIHSIIGIGLNVNEKKFPDDLPQAISLAILSDKEFDRDEILLNIISELKKTMLMLENDQKKMLKSMYLQRLYKYQQPQMFRTQQNELMMAKIIDVDDLGKLILEDSDEIKSSYGFKEIQFIY
ncbi:biotin--[acetyl-CoA-carboxylase] ligase [Namhaeicola litoreus]|uniref:Biotin--[acetyl-CoA-carboxylase] ligase n=1 Tax=Namhaeicola litoreus TaxID=1052145 RepID=A0ABW3Y4X1_9FLAO